MAKTILCIEDNPDNMMLVKRVMMSLGYLFEAASNGIGGIDRAMDVHPDLILLDINLPDIDGYEVARQIRASEQEWLKVVPIIALTANALKGDAEKAMAAGCDVYMSKPINIHELSERIDEMLGMPPRPDSDL